MKSFACLAFIISLAALCGCGGGGGGGTAQATYKTATLKLATIGTLTRNLAGVSISVVMPAGVTPALNSNGSVSSSVAQVSGVAAPGSILSSEYTAATRKLSIYGLTSNIQAGFDVGEFVTIKLIVPLDMNPQVADFVLGDLDPVDNIGTHLAAGVLTPIVKEYTLQ